MGDVVLFTGVTRLDMPADRILEKALKCDCALASVVIMGYDEAGEEYFASSIADGGTVLWLMERLKKKLLDVPETLNGC